MKTKVFRTGIQNLPPSAGRALGACEAGREILYVEQTCWTGRGGLHFRARAQCAGDGLADSGDHGYINYGEGRSKLR